VPHDASVISSVGIAVVGAGGWGRNHVRNFASSNGATLRCVCDLSETIRRDVAATYPAVEVTDDVARVAADPSVAGVVVATHAPSHAQVAEMLLRAGKDVLVEKPLALSGTDARRLAALAGAEGRILMVGHLLLYHPAVQALQTLVVSGDLGDVLYLYAQRLNLGVVRRDENAWWSLAPHDISVASYLFGADPIAVSATGATFLQPERRVEDVVFASLEYPNGRLAHVHVSWLDPHKTRQVTVVGSKKMAVFDDTSSDMKLRVYDKGVEPPASLTYAEGDRVRTGDIRIPALRMQEPLRRECDAFIEAIRTRKAPLASGASGVPVVRALEAGALSLKRGGARVALAEIPCARRSFTPRRSSSTASSSATDRACGTSCTSARARASAQARSSARMSSSARVS
jgi:predicted dehydrogenase